MHTATTYTYPIRQLPSRNEDALFWFCAPALAHALLCSALLCLSVAVARYVCGEHADTKHFPVVWHGMHHDSARLLRRAPVFFLTALLLSLAIFGLTLFCSEQAALITHFSPPVQLFLFLAFVLLAEVPRMVEVLPR